jgi:Tfp pilus assembly protein PilF
VAQAVRELEQLLQIDPDNADAHTNLGVVFASQGQQERAAREFAEALRLNPGQAKAREGLRLLGR